MGSLKIKARLLDEKATLPSYAHHGDGGVDLYASCDITLAPLERALIPTGLSVAIPQGYAGFVLPRSGLAIKHGLSLVNSPGLIDSGYRGEIKVIAVNLDPKHSFTVHNHDRVAQLVVMRVEDITLVACEYLDETERGSGGFGSSGLAETLE